MPPVRRRREGPLFLRLAEGRLGGLLVVAAVEAAEGALGAGDGRPLDAQLFGLRCDLALEALSTDRAQVGSTINNLQSAVDNLSSTIENYGNAMSQIRDTDMASESSDFSKSQVLQQAGVAMLSQANAQPNLVLRLLG